MANEKEIVIDLVDSKYDFSVNELIHQNEFSQIVLFIDEQLSEDEKVLFEGSCSKKALNSVPSINRTIMLNGARGTGKTSFLQTLVDELPEVQRTESNETFCNTLEILDFLDPTLIEEKASVFLTIISLICGKVENKFDKSCDKEHTLQKKKAWQTVLDTFARGLPVINESEKHVDYWDDASQIMEKGLKDVRSAFNLRKNFSKFLKESLEILGKKSFLLVIDDVDTDSQKAFPLLETLRKYLCVNGIITLISGDLQLFSTVIRNKQCKKFTDKSVESPLVKKQIEELTNQYLKKVLPVRYRVPLPRLSQLINTRSVYNYTTRGFDNTSLTVRYNEKLMPIPVKEFFRRVFFNLGIASNFQREGYTDFLLNLSLRTQIEWMRFFKGYGDEFSYKNTISFNQNTFSSLFIDELLQNGINVNLLIYNPNFINNIIVGFLTKNNMLSDAYQLQATSNDDSINGVFFTLSLLLSNYIRNKPSLIFDYLIKIGYTRNLIPVFQKKTKNSDSPYSFDGLISQMGITNDKDVRQMVCQATAYLRAMKTDKPKLVGVIKLADAKSLVNENGNGNGIELNDYIARLPYSRSLVGKGGVHEYSLFTLLGAINDLIRDFESGDDLQKILQRISQPRDYEVFSEDEDTQTSKEEDDNDETVINETDFETMNDELNDWLEDAKRQHRYIASHVLAKTATRLYYTFSNLNFKNTKSLGDMMHLYVIALFNAVIVEETMELTADSKSDYKGIKITNKNVLSTPEIFKNNLNAIQNALGAQQLPLTRIILTCPILLFFINFDSKQKETKALFDSFDIIQKNSKDYVRWQFNEFKEFYEKHSCYQKLNKLDKDGKPLDKNANKSSKSEK